MVLRSKHIRDFSDHIKDIINNNSNVSLIKVLARKRKKKEGVVLDQSIFGIFLSIDKSKDVFHTLPS